MAKSAGRKSGTRGTALAETTDAVAAGVTACGAPAVLTMSLPEVSEESLLGPLYETVGNPAAWRNFLDRLSQAYGDGMGTLMIHDFKLAQTFAETPEFGDGKNKTSYMGYYAGLNPWISAGSQREAGAIMVSDNLVPFNALARTEFYNDWCRPQNIGGGVGVMVESTPRRIMSVTVLLSRERMDRHDDLTGRLQRLTPHLLRVAQLNRQFAALEARAEAAEGALDRLATAMLVLDAEGQVLYLNPQAERIMAAGDGMTLRGGKLETQRVDQTQALRGLIASAAASLTDITVPPGGVMAISRRSGRRSYEVLAAPIPETTVRLGFGGLLVAVFIREPEARVTTPVAWLRQIYGLTAAEGRLMQALLAGDGLNEVATRFMVTRETVRSQLKAIFQKTGATSQGDLIRLGMRSLTARYR